jgi:hypothetical protein
MTDVDEILARLQKYDAVRCISLLPDVDEMTFEENYETFAGMEHGPVPY